MKNFADCTAGRAGTLHGTLLAVVLLISLCLNLFGNSWGTPERWYPDEIDGVAAGMVAQKTLNPHFFFYGGWHYLVLGLTAVVPVGAYNYFLDPKPQLSEPRALAEWRTRKDTRIRVLARTTSAVLATLTVLVTYAIARLLFTRATGLLAAAFLALSSYFILIAHFATVDTAANFWYWLACLLALLAWKRGATPWYALGAFTIGLACGTKIDRVLAIIPWMAALVSRPASSRISWGKALGYAALIPLGYVCANPTLLSSFFEFAEGTSTDLIFNALRGSGAFLPMLAEMARGMSWPLFTVAGLGLFYLGYQAARGSERREILWLLATIVPMYLVFGSRLSMPWYCVFFYPGLAIIGAHAAVKLICSAQSRPVVRFTAIAAVLFAGSWSLLRGIAVDQQFTQESRYAAAAWIEARVPRGAVIEVSHRGPVLAPGRYEVTRDPIPQEYYDDAQEWRQHLQSSAAYRIIQATLRNMARWTGSTSAPAYNAWFDRVMHPKSDAESTSQAPAAPDYRVVLDYLDEALLRKLQGADSGYQLLAEFHYQHPWGLDVPFPFVNPRTYVFKRVDQHDTSAPSASE
jgi:hypothetical protein